MAKPGLLAGLGTLIDGLSGETYQARQIHEHVALKKSELAKGVSRGQFVVLKMSNRPEFFFTLLACWELEVAPVIMPPRSSLQEIKNVRSHFCAAAVAGDDSLDFFLSGQPEALIDFPEIHTKTAMVLLTSGTLGKPKAIFLSFEALAEKFKALANEIPLNERENTMCFLPLCFGHGLICNSLFPLLSNSNLFIFPSFELASIPLYLRAIEKHPIHFFSTVPVVLKLMMKQQLPPHNLRRVHCASAPLALADWNSADEWLGNGTSVTHVYGLTEFAGWVAGSSKKEARAEGLVGKPWGVEVRTFENQGPGEISLRGPSCMTGYLDQGVFSLVRKDSWFPTGDIGTIEANGSIILRGRQKDVINYGGFKIYPQDVEALLAQHPAVAEVCVFAAHNENLGEVPAAACVLKNNQVNEKELKKWCMERIHANKVPVRWYFPDELPISERGKVSRHKVRELCEKSSKT